VRSQGGSTRLITGVRQGSDDPHAQLKSVESCMLVTSAVALIGQTTLGGGYGHSMAQRRKEREDRDEARARGLIELAAGQFPITTLDNEAANAWELVGPALISRQISSVEAIFELRVWGREADPTTLCRSLYDYATTFAWIAADPGPIRHQRFLKHDLLRRLEADADCRKLTIGGEPLTILTDEQRADFERQLAELPDGTKRMPDLVDLAEAVDKHWTGKIAGLAGSDTTHSYRGFYALAYRRESAITHATMMGLNPVVAYLADGRRRVQLETREDDSHGPFGRAVTLFGWTMMIAARTLSGWPSDDDVHEVFDTLR
jgi:hypothetical protein